MTLQNLTDYQQQLKKKTKLGESFQANAKLNKLKHLFLSNRHSEVKWNQDNLCNTDNKDNSVHKW